MSEQQDPEDQRPPLNIVLPEAHMSGVYANYAQVAHSQYEFTIDFARLDFGTQNPTQGIVVTRVSLSPLLVSQLIDALNNNWARYIERAMPPEVTGYGQIEGEQNDDNADPPTQS